MKFSILILIIGLVSAEDFRETWRFYPNNPNACSVKTKSNPEKSFSQLWSVGSFGADPKCKQDASIGVLERACLERFTSETNNYDLNKPVNGPGAPKIYGQLACERFAVDLDTTMVLQVSYLCTGNNSFVDKLEASYDVLERKGIAIKIKCQGGKYIPQ